MKGKILFLCTAHYDLYRIFEDGFKKYTDYEVQTVLYKRYKYKSHGERVTNFLSKVFLNKNLKRIKGSEQYLEGLDDHYDYLFMICPEMVLPQHLTQLTKKADKTVVYYWDGFDHFPQAIPTIKYFQRAFTFDRVDAKKYDINFITNFYFHEKRNTNYEYDLFFLASYDSRYPLIAKIAKSLQQQNKKVVIKLHANKSPKIKEKIPQGIEFINEFISFEATKEYMSKARIILDIHKNIHTGLSFRIFEAMGLGKKLITTNPDVVNYDFYNANNIFVWTEDTEALPTEFISSPYEELPDEIYKKYSQENWVKTILGITT